MSNELKFSLFLICGFLNLKSQHLYISDAGNFQQGPHQIIKSDLDGGNAKLFIKDKLAWPQDILFLPDKKEVLVSNLSSGKIEKYHAETGVHISTFASGIQGTTRMKIGKDNLIYVLQWAGNGKVKRFDQTGKFIDDFTTTGVDQAIGLDWDKNGDFYVSSYRGLFIERFDTEGKSKGKFISTGLFGPTNIHFNEAGELIVLDYNSGRILLYTSNGTLIKTIAQGAAHCEGISFSKNGNMFIGTKSQINVYNIDGSFNKIITLPSDIKILNVNAVVEYDITVNNTEFDITKNDSILVLKGHHKYELNNEFSNIFEIFIYNSNGMEVHKEKLDNKKSIDLSHLNSGIYVVKARTAEDKKYTQKIVIVK